MSEEAIENKLGTKITTLREAHHLTQQDRADRCQCDIETIQGLENGELCIGDRCRTEPNDGCSLF